MGRVLIGVIVGIILVPVAVLAWLHFGSVPVAVSDAPLPQERSITQSALHKRVDREMIATPPIQVNEDNLVTRRAGLPRSMRSLPRISRQALVVWTAHVPSRAAAV